MGASMHLPSPKQKRQLCPLKLKAEIKIISRVCSSSTEPLHSLHSLQQRDRIPLTHQRVLNQPPVFYSSWGAETLLRHWACTSYPLKSFVHVRVPSWQHLLQLLQALADLLPAMKAGTLLDPGAKPPGCPDSQVETCRAEPGTERGEKELTQCLHRVDAFPRMWNTQLCSQYSHCLGKASQEYHPWGQYPHI